MGTHTKRWSGGGGVSGGGEQWAVRAVKAVRAEGVWPHTQSPGGGGGGVGGGGGGGGEGGGGVGLEEPEPLNSSF